MAFCLPEFATQKFLAALKSGEIDPAKLAEMTSDERRAAFTDIVGESNAKEVNAQFESKLLLKNQQVGFINWAKNVAGLKPEVTRDLVSRVQKMTDVLTPENEDAFYKDLAEKKLGVGVSHEEAGQIADMAQKTTDALEAMKGTPAGSPERIAYGRQLMDFNDYVQSLKPDGRTFSEKIIDIANIPKSALTSIFHLSAPFVQGWGMVSTGVFWKAFGDQFKYFGSEEAYKNLDAYIISHPDYDLAKSGGLALTKLGDKLDLREEALQSTLVQKAGAYISEKTGAPDLVRASSRSFTGFLNEVRFNRFTNLLDAARLAGEDVRKGGKVVKDLAKTVNDFTGRGNLGKNGRYDTAAPALNSLFFSPRKISATMEMFDPVRYLDPKISPTARMGALRQLSGSLIATTAVLGLARLAGAQVNPDPRSTNFGKIQIGGETLDVSGGNVIYLRLLARLATNQEITSKGVLENLGQGYKPTTRADLLLSFLRDKLSPVASAVADGLYGTNPVGQPTDFNPFDGVSSEEYDKLTPIVMQDFINFAMNDPHNTAAMLPALSAIFGVELTSPTPPLKKK
jgi:hypothetical protein